MTVSEHYARGVISGEIVAGKLIRLAAQRFLSDLERDDLYFDESEANRAVNFIEKRLCHWEGSFSGRPLILSPWQVFIVHQIFGWKWKATGKRRIRSVYIQIARKNGKTAFLAAIILYHIFADHENTPQVLVGANNEDQAKICTNSVGRMVLSSPMLHEMYEDKEIKLFQYNDKYQGLTYPERVGEMRAISKNPETKDGFNPSLGGVDEYHEAKNDLLLNVIESGQVSRENPLLIVITTAGFDKAGPCYSKLRESSVQILNGSLEDDHHLAFIYEQDEDDDVANEATWIKSNPNLGVSVSLEALQSRYKKALNEGGTKMVDFLTKNLNKWVDAPEVWIPNEVWITNRKGLDISDLRGKMCYGGLDLASSDDINAFALWFPKYDDTHHAVIPFFWVPEAKLQNAKERVDYRKWIDLGLIKKTPGVKADHQQIIADIQDLQSVYDIRSISYDRHYFHHSVARGLSDILTCHDIQQDVRTLNFPMRELAALIQAGELEHFGNPVLTWMMGNVTLFKDSSGNIKPDKAKSKNKIDGVAAMLNAYCEYKTFEGQQIDLTFSAI